MQTEPTKQPTYYLDAYKRFDIEGNPVVLQNGASPQIFIANSYSSLDLFRMAVQTEQRLMTQLKNTTRCDAATSKCYNIDGTSYDASLIQQLFEAALAANIAALISMIYALDATDATTPDEINKKHADIIAKQKQLQNSRKDLDEILQKYDLQKPATKNGEFLVSDNKFQMEYTLYTQALLVILLCSILFMFFVHL